MLTGKYEFYLGMRLHQQGLIWKKGIPIKHAREYPQRENDYMFSTLDTRDNAHLCTYVIPNSVSGIVRRRETQAHTLTALEKMAPIVMGV